MSSQINDTNPVNNLIAVKPETISMHFRNTKSEITANTLLKSLLHLQPGYFYIDKTKTKQTNTTTKKPQTTNTKQKKLKQQEETHTKYSQNKQKLLMN